MKASIKAKIHTVTAGMQDDAHGTARAAASAPIPRPPLRRPTLNHAAPEADLAAQQLDELRKDLEERRARLAEAIEIRRQEERELGTTRDVGDEMDDATAEGVASMTSKLLERDVMLLGEVNHALVKFSDGSYGVCEGTGEPIGFERLRLRPWARYSVAHQEELERAARTRGGGGS